MNAGCVHLHVPACIKRLSVNIHALRALHVSACVSTFQALGVYSHVLARVLS
jgi:hypothetical protein